MQRNYQQRLEKLADIQEGLVLISFPVYVIKISLLTIKKKKLEKSINNLLI
jgi:hypothetical protein